MNNNNNNNVNSMVDEIRTGFRSLFSEFKLVNGKCKVYIKSDGLYDIDDIRIYKFDLGKYTENCRTAAVKVLREQGSMYTPVKFVTFPKRKNAPAILE